MVLLKVQPDTQWLIAEEPLRFSVDYSVPPEKLFLHIALDFQKSLDILERTRKWTFLPTVPHRKQFADGVPCCSEILLKRPGETLPVRYEKSGLQADSDDAHNTGEVYDGSERLVKDGLIDWIAICHFWQPGIWIDPDEVREGLAVSAKDGFLPAAESGSQKVKEIHKKWQL